MDAKNALRRIVTLSGKTQRQISSDMGRSENFVSAVRTQKRTPNADLMAEMAQACGYDLQLAKKGGGEVITIDGGD